MIPFSLCGLNWAGRKLRPEVMEMSLSAKLASLVKIDFRGHKI